MIKNEFLENNLRAIVLIILIGAMAIYSFFATDGTEKKEKIVVPKMETVIENDVKDWRLCCGQTGSPYQVKFIQIKKISFATDKKYLFVRYDLSGKLPESTEKLPSYNYDKLSGAVYYLNFDLNYFDSEGNKNPANYEAMAEFSFYGKPAEEKNDGRLNVEGELAQGGPGNDYFVVRFPYRQLLFGQTKTEVVFQTWSIAVSKKFRGGASKGLFENKQRAIAADDLQNIRVSLQLKN